MADEKVDYFDGIRSHFEELEVKVKAEKVSEEHLKQMQQTVNAISQLQFNIGKIEAQKHQLLHGLIEAQGGIQKLQDMLVKEYGTYDVNLDNGTINWPEEKSDEK